MAIVFEKWPRWIELYGWEESPSRLPVEADQQQVVTDVRFLDAAEAASYLRDFLGQEQEAVARLRALFASEHALSYGQVSDEEVFVQFGSLLAQNAYRIRQTSVYRAAWGKKPPAPPAPLPPSAPPKQIDPPKPVQNKATLAEFIEVVNRAGQGSIVVTGAGPTSNSLTQHLVRQDKHGQFFKQFININKDVEGLANSRAEYGRYIEIKAKVTLDGKPKAGEAVIFSYIRHAGEFSPVLMSEEKEGFYHNGGPATCSAITGHDGWTNTEVFYLSAYAGDCFELFATGPDGNTLKIGTYQVWRKFWYQITYAGQQLVLQPVEAEDAYAQVFAQMVFTQTVQIPQASVPARSFYPAWMAQFPPGSGGAETVFLAGSHNTEELFQQLIPESDKPVKAHLVLCDAVWREKNRPAPVEVFTIYSNPSKRLIVNLDGTENAGLLKPTLSGAPLVIHGSWSSKNKKGVLTDENILLEQAGRSDETSFRQLKIVLPSDAPQPSINNPITIRLQLRHAYCLGGYSENENIVILNDVNNPKLFNDTVTHELGHSFNQTPDAGFQSKSLPDHPNQYTMQGTHCSTGASKYIPDPNYPELFTYLDGQCVMFHARNPAGSGKFCSVCEPYIRLETMQRLF